MENFREEVVQKFIDALHADTAPFQTGKVEGRIEVRPFAAVSNKPFYGAGSLVLSMRAHAEGYDDPRWMTIRQASSLGYRVRDGETGVALEMWSSKVEQPVLGEDGEYVRDAEGNVKTETVESSRPQVSYVTMFNAGQIDGIPPYNRHESLDLGKDRLAVIGDVLNRADMNVVMNDDGEIGYDTGTDTLKVPNGGKPAERVAGHRAVLKDLGYATIHENRLDRRELMAQTPENAAKEELRVAIAAGRIAGATGLGSGPEIGISEDLKPAVVRLLQSDVNELFRATRDADRIARWYLEPDSRDQLREQRASIRAAEAKRAEGREAMKPENRHFLNVPYDDRHEIKALGGVWHREYRLWSVAKTIDPKKIDKWDVADLPSSKATPMQEFGDFIRNAGYVLEGDAVMDGEWRRVELSEANARPGAEKTASYCGWIDGKPNGMLTRFDGNNTVKEKWVAVGQSLSPNQVVALQQEYRKNSAELGAETAKAREEAATRAHGIFSNNGWANDGNCKYLASHGIDGDSWTKVSREGNLLVPLRDNDGRIHNLQIISDDGVTFLRGGRKEGCYHEIRGSGGSGTSQLLVTADLPDAFTLNRATGRTACVAFDVNNMASAASALRAKFPQSDITIATGAVDEFTMKKIEKAAGKVGGRVLVAEGAASFNELRTGSGLEAVREQVNRVLQPELAEGRAAEAGTDPKTAQKTAAKGRSR